MITKIEHFENGELTFYTKDSFVKFVRVLYKENEEPDTPLRGLQGYRDSLIYVLLYCSNFEVTYSELLEKDSGYVE